MWREKKEWEESGRKNGRKDLKRGLYHYKKKKE